MRGPSYWRAPSWAPLWIKRIFRGRWTQAEVDDIKRRAREKHASMQRFVD